MCTPCARDTMYTMRVSHIFFEMMEVQPAPSMSSHSLSPHGSTSLPAGWWQSCRRRLAVCRACTERQCRESSHEHVRVLPELRSLRECFPIFTLVTLPVVTRSDPAKPRLSRLFKNLFFALTRLVHVDGCGRDDPFVFVPGWNVSVSRVV